MTQPPHQLEIVTDPSRLHGLKAEWDGLYLRHPAPHLSDSFDWATLSWTAVTSRRGRRLCCIVMRRGPRLVAIWPLVLTSGRWVNVASPLTSEGPEYCPCLVDPREAPAALWKTAREALAAQIRADALRLPHVRPDSPAHHLVGGLREARATIVQPAPLVRAADFPGGEAYARQLPASTRAAVRRGRRRLEELGRVEFVEIGDEEERKAVLDWVLARKRAWLTDHGLSNPRLLSEANAGFLEATLRQPGIAHRRRVFALKVDGALVAAEIASVDGGRVEAFNSTFDPAYRACSPGHMLTLEVIRWALDRGLDYDFRPGAETYKLKWASQVVPVTSYLVPLTLRGRLFVGYRLARRWFAARSPRSLRRWVQKPAS